jgi:hypothetical protein
MSDAGDARIRALRQKMTEAFKTVDEAREDGRCGDAADWILRSILRPKAPGSLAVPDPTAAGGEIVRVLCDRFGV